MTFRIKRTAVKYLDDREGCMKTTISCSVGQVLWPAKAPALRLRTALGCAFSVASRVMILQIERSIRHLFVMNGWSIQITAGVPSRAPATCRCYLLSLESFTELWLSYLCALKIIQTGDEVKRKICNEDVMRIVELNVN